MSTYIPKPIATTNVELSSELTNLAELIAKNVHDVWAEKRISQGWSFGPERNDHLKQTPCLVEYEELTDEEKDYDRSTALETIRLITKLGFKITKE